MTEQEFLELVSLHVETWYKPKCKQCYSYREGHGWTKRMGQALKNINLDDCVMVTWVCGGIRGGSCWDESGHDSHYSIQGDIEPELLELDMLLEQVCPNITLIQYKKLLNGVQPSLIEYDDWGVNEYYGNSTDYRAKMVSLRRLYERLTALELLG